MFCRVKIADNPPTPREIAEKIIGNLIQGLIKIPPFFNYCMQNEVFLLFKTANIVKTANAAFMQTEAINKLKLAGKFASLTDELLEAAELRLNNPEMSLSALCKLSKTGLTRSGLNHRIQKLIEMAEEI